MVQPFQCIIFSTLAPDGNPSFLLAASRSRVFVCSAQDGSLLSIWQSNQSQFADLQSKHIKVDELGKEKMAERPAKRRKKGSTDNESGGSSAEIVTEASRPRARKSSRPVVTEPNVIKLAATSDGQAVVAVTDEDKNEKTILCGDKFGDVYALPLYPAQADNDQLQQLDSVKDATETEESQICTFTPSANARTVHTLRNQKTLQYQLNTTTKNTQPKTPEFKHQLLLGHVSLLTAIACVEIPTEEASQYHARNYIITADRDEHIRVSRGMPQAHIIEGFCLGHTQFVSKICVLPWKPRCLISGGGDSHLLVWDWLAGRILHKVDLRHLVTEYIKHHHASPKLLGHTEIAVCELQSTQTRTATGELRGYLVVAMEGFPAIFLFSVAEDGLMQHDTTISTSGNVVALTVSKSQDQIAYAIDTVHLCFSQSQLSDKNRISTTPMIEILNFSKARAAWEHGSDVVSRSIHSSIRELASDADDARESRDLLYGLENLRKRGSG
ncbi:MAG: hypothetical protein Q9207_002608 [Kuettlingeria erythrocarpa]